MKIDIKDNKKDSNEKPSDYPYGSVYSGKNLEDADLKIFIKHETLQRIDSYLRSDTNNELGGVLIGNVCNNEGDRFIKIDNLIIAKHSNSSLSRLTFTHDTWIYINEILEKDFPDKKILGWFHSHPGHTVFMSNFDIFIQENFFNMNYMVAYVYDPTIDDRGFFFWKDKKIEKSNGYYIYDMVNDENSYKPDPVKSDPGYLSEISNEEKKHLTPGSGFKSNVILIVLLVNLLLLLLMIYNYIDLRKTMPSKDELGRELNDVKIENEKIKQRLDNFIVDYELQKGGINSKSSKENVSVPKGNENTNITVAGDSLENKVVKEMITYIVKPGDSLEKIARAFYKNKSGIEIVMKQNNLKSKSEIKIGQVLEIPQYIE